MFNKLNKTKVKMKKEDVLAKIKKLMQACGEGAVNENEIATANKVIKKLVDKYNITSEQLEGIKKEQILLSKVSCSVKRYSGWKSDLAVCVAEYYDSSILIVGKREFLFIGFDLDPEVAKEMYLFIKINLQRAGRKIYKAKSRRGEQFSRYSFYTGAVASIFRRLQQMKIEKTPQSDSSELVLVKSQEIKKCLCDFDEIKDKRTQVDRESYFVGKAHGNEINLHEQLGDF